MNMEETSPQPTPEAIFDSSATKDIVTLDGDDVKHITERFSVDDTRELSEVEEEAVRIFGITTDFAEAGYILPDGRLLRMADEEHRGERSYDHRAIAMAYGAEVDLNTNHGFSAANGRYLDAFVEAGNIRFDAGEPDLGMDIGLQLSKTVPLTKAQERTIRDLVEWKEKREENVVQLIAVENGDFTPIFGENMKNPGILNKYRDSFVAE